MGGQREGWGGEGAPMPTEALQPVTCRIFARSASAIACLFIAGAIPRVPGLFCECASYSRSALAFLRIGLFLGWEWMGGGDGM